MVIITEPHDIKLALLLYGNSTNFLFLNNRVFRHFWTTTEKKQIFVETLNGGVAFTLIVIFVSYLYEPAEWNELIKNFFTRGRDDDVS